MPTTNELVLNKLEAMERTLNALKEEQSKITITLVGMEGNPGGGLCTRVDNCEKKVSGIEMKIAGISATISLVAAYVWSWFKGA